MEWLRGTWTEDFDEDLADLIDLDWEPQYFSPGTNRALGFATFGAASRAAERGGHRKKHP